MIGVLLLLALYFAYGPGLGHDAPTQAPLASVDDCSRWVKTSSVDRDTRSRALLVQLRENDGVVRSPDEDMVSYFDQEVFDACQRRLSARLTSRAADREYWSG